MANNKDYDYFFNNYLNSHGGGSFLGSKYPRSAVRKANPTLAAEAHEDAVTKLRKTRGPLSQSDRDYLNTDDAGRARMDAEREATDAINDMYGIGDGAGMALPEMYGDFDDSGDDYQAQPSSNSNSKSSPNTNKEETPESDEDEDESPEEEPGAYDDDNDGYNLAKDPAAKSNYADKNAMMDSAEVAGEAAETGEAAAAATAATEAAVATTETVEVVGGLAAAWPWILGIVVVIICIILLIWLLQTLAVAFPGQKCGNAAVTATTGNNVIVLDPGHISEDKVRDDGTGLDWNTPGASGYGLDEYKVVWKIANAIKPELESKGYKVVITKSSVDEKMTNKDRAEVGNSNNALLNFRIHNDGNGANKPGGFFFIYPDRSGKINNSAGGATGPPADVLTKSKSATDAFFTAIKDPMTKAGMGPNSTNGGEITDKKNGEKADNNGGVLRQSLFSKVPTTLIEIGNLSSKTDAAWLAKDSNITALGKILANGIAAAAPIQTTTPAATTATSGNFFFPLQGTQTSYSGSSKASGQPRGPQKMIIASSATFQWPLPALKWPFSKYKDKENTNSDQPNFGACRGGSTTKGDKGYYEKCWRQHFGDDLYATFGTPIVAPEDGTIIKYGGGGVYATTESSGGGIGRWLTIKGASGNIYTFMHTEGFSDAVMKGLGLSKQIGNMAEKAASAAVKGGSVIAYVGNTGGIQNPHLHFQLGPKDGEKDPTDLLNSWLKGLGSTPALTSAPQASNECDATVTPTATGGNAIVAAAKKYLGTPYLWGGGDFNGPTKGCGHGYCGTGFDCSGLALYAVYQGTNGKVKLSHYSQAQYDETTRISSGSEQPGDLVFFHSPISHVAIVIGDGKMIEAPQTGEVVKISNYKTRNPVGFGRPKY